jgi:uncharacterized protein YhbP (UPF0306 family)
MTVATVGAEGMPWVAHVFYAWLANERVFVFTSDVATRHGSEMAGNERVAAGVALETRTVGRVQGLQIEGRVHRAVDEELAIARTAYLKRFPYAIVAPLSLWVLEPSAMKLTDNTLGFGRKIVWQRRG